MWWGCGGLGWTGGYPRVLRTHQKPCDLWPALSLPCNPPPPTFCRAGYLVILLGPLWSPFLWLGVCSDSRLNITGSVCDAPTHSWCRAILSLSPLQSYSGGTCFIEIPPANTGLFFRQRWMGNWELSGSVIRGSSRKFPQAGSPHYPPGPDGHPPNRDCCVLRAWCPQRCTAWQPCHWHSAWGPTVPSVMTRPGSSSPCGMGMAGLEASSGYRLLTPQLWKGFGNPKTQKMSCCISSSVLYSSPLSSCQTPGKEELGEQGLSLLEICLIISQNPT